MTDLSPAKKKYTIRLIASLKGVNKGENALKRLGFSSTANFAKSQFLALSAVKKFFHREPIEMDSFKRICNKLKLNWKEIAEIEEKQSQVLMNKKYSTPNIDEVIPLEQKPYVTVSVTDERSQTVTVKITLKQNAKFSYNFQCIEFILREYSANSIKKIDIQPDVVNLIIEVSQQDIQRLVSQIESAQLIEVNIFSLERVQIIDQNLDDDEKAEVDYKWCLVQEIVSQPVEGRDLRGVDLSNADLSNADLSCAYLSGADLSGADLSGVDLSGADLSGADLSGADLIDATTDEETKLDQKWRLVLEIVNNRCVGRDLSNANLSSANLSGTYLSGANLCGSYLNGTDLSSADLSCAEVIGADLIGADLSDADLVGANLCNSYLSGTNLSGANLSGANLSDANLIGTNLRGANLSGANLSGVNLIGANLIGAIVKNTRFGTNARLNKDMRLDLERQGAIFDQNMQVAGGERLIRKLRETAIA